MEYSKNYKAMCQANKKKYNSGQNKLCCLLPSRCLIYPPIIIVVFFTLKIMVNYLNSHLSLVDFQFESLKFNNFILSNLISVLFQFKSLKLGFSSFGITLSLTLDGIMT